MSTYWTVDDEDIEIDLKFNEVDFLVTADQFGSVYLTLTFDQIKSIRNKILSLDQEKGNET